MVNEYMPVFFIGLFFFIAGIILFIKNYKDYKKIPNTNNITDQLCGSLAILANSAITLFGFICIIIFIWVYIKY